ncbi:MAG TPA: hypothetical protein VNF04_13940 [Stellaceae bacterium]|nr:hypothetical protein [Stellaceae bacterium]
MIKVGPFLVAALTLAVAALAMASAGSVASAARAKKHAPPPPHREATPGAQSLGTFDSWTAYESADKVGRICYVVGVPKKSEPAGLARQEPMAMVTHRPAENIANVVSFVEGYPIKEGSDVVLEVGRHKFELFTKDDSAWARTSDLDRTIVTTLAKSGQVVAKGTPQKGPATTDIYSLAGFPKALAAIDKACGVKREESASPPPARAAKHRHPPRHRAPH